MAEQWAHYCPLSVRLWMFVRQSSCHTAAILACCFQFSSRHFNSTKTFLFTISSFFSSSADSGISIHWTKKYDGFKSSVELPSFVSADEFNGDVIFQLSSNQNASYSLSQLHNFGSPLLVYYRSRHHSGLANNRTLLPTGEGTSGFCDWPFPLPFKTTGFHTIVVTKMLVPYQIKFSNSVSTVLFVKKIFWFWISE